MSIVLLSLLVILLLTGLFKTTIIFENMNRYVFFKESVY